MGWGLGSKGNKDNGKVRGFSTTRLPLPSVPISLPFQRVDGRIPHVRAVIHLTARRSTCATRADGTQLYTCGILVTVTEVLPCPKNLVGVQIRPWIG